MNSLFQLTHLKGGSKPPLRASGVHWIREGHPDSFGAICGGEVTVLMEPQRTAEAIYLVGAGHCGKAIAQAARACGLGINVIEDRADFGRAVEPADCKIAHLED